MSTTKKRPISEYEGPTPMRDLSGCVVVQFGRFPDCPELYPDYTAAVIGWGSQLVATGPDLDELAEYLERRFDGKVRLAVGEERNPRNWRVARW